MPFGVAPKVSAGTGSTPLGPSRVLVSLIFKNLQSETGKDRLMKCVYKIVFKSDLYFRVCMGNKKSSEETPAEIINLLYLLIKLVSEGL